MLLTEFYKNKKCKLNFKKVDISESEIYPYFKRKYDLYESNKFPQRMISGIRRLATHINENKEADQIAPFINKLQSSGLGLDTDIRVGDELSVLDFEINFPYQSITVRGFTVPLVVTKILLNSDDTINYVRFSNGDRYPRLTPAVYSGKPVDYAVYSSDKASAEKTLTMLMLSVPSDWEIETDELVRESKTATLAEALDRTGAGDSAVVGWGRGMGHKGHMFLASAVITQAKEKNADPYFVVSRTVGKDDPITPEEKLAIYRKVFPQSGHIFQTATDEMPDLTRVLKDLYAQGYKNVTVVVGADQKAALGYVMNYNGKPDKAGNILFNFDNLNVISRQETSDPSAGEEGPRATPMRAVLLDPTKTDDEKFALWRDAMNPELTDNEVRDLMNKAQSRMQAVPVKKPAAPKKPVVKKEPALAESAYTSINWENEMHRLITILENKK